VCHRWKTDWWGQMKIGSWCTHYWSCRMASNDGWNILFVQVCGICSSRLGLICQPVNDLTNDSNRVDGKLHYHLSITPTVIHQAMHINLYQNSIGKWGYQTCPAYRQMIISDKLSIFITPIQPAIITS
jgi:hypothetical protein